MQSIDRDESHRQKEKNSYPGPTPAHKDTSPKFFQTRDEKSPTELKELKATQESLEQTQKDLKKAVFDFEELSIMVHGTKILTDADIITQIKRLRGEIKNFTLQYYDSDTEEYISSRRRPNFNKYLKTATSGICRNKKQLSSTKNCRKIVQAFLWRVLAGEVFEQFHWLGAKFSDDMRRLRAKLRPVARSCSSTEKRPHSNPKAEGKFQVWSAMTTGMLRAARKESAVRSHLRLIKSQIMRNITRTITWASSQKNEGFREQLGDILDAALKLDEEISSQIARIEWVFDFRPSKEGENITSAMGSDSDDALPESSQGVRFVVEPAVIKCGKSTGGGFELERRLINMAVYPKYI